MCAGCCRALLTLPLGLPDESAFLKHFPLPTNTAAWPAVKEIFAAGEIKYTSVLCMQCCTSCAALLWGYLCCFLFLFSLQRQPPNSCKKYWLYDSIYFFLEMPNSLASGWLVDGAIQQAQKGWLCLEFDWTLKICRAETQMALTHMVLGMTVRHK